MKAAARLFQYLKALALAGESCPKSVEIAATIGLTHHQVGHAFEYLRDENRIECKRVGQRRIVRLLGIGLETADPRPPETITVRPPVRSIIDAAAEAFGTTAKGIVSRSRFVDHVAARRAVCFTAMNRGWSSPQVGRVLAGRDHSTVIHHRDAARRLALSDAGFAARLAAVETRTPLPVEKVL